MIAAASSTFGDRARKFHGVSLKSREPKEKVIHVTTLNPIDISLIAFACIFGAAALGVTINGRLPEKYFDQRTHDIIKAARDVIVSVAALTLGLLIASAKTSFDERAHELRSEASKSVMMDRILYQFGPETRHARQLVREMLVNAAERIEHAMQHGVDEEKKRRETLSDALHLEVISLRPKGEIQGELKAEAIALSKEIMQARWMVQQSLLTTIQLPLLFILVFWLSCIFLYLGLGASPNLGVVATLLLAAISMAGAVYLTLAFDRPYQGLVRVSAEPFRLALQHLKPLP